MAQGVGHRVLDGRHPPPRPPFAHSLGAERVARRGRSVAGGVHGGPARPRRPEGGPSRPPAVASAPRDGPGAGSRASPGRPPAERTFAPPLPPTGCPASARRAPTPAAAAPATALPPSWSDRE